ncbi:MAG: TetR/AcrR family transcriptional regulator [Deltaproteobacteria bacterium]|nr:TetR/AcrR family transcriptional regulator [Deltaproteobacteria bacterium]
MAFKPKPTKKEVVTAFRTREILAAAREVMECRGVESATMDEIAHAAGIAKGTIYLYFQSKEDLLHALMSQVGENLLRNLEDIAAAPLPPPEKLVRVLTLLLEYLEREQVLFPIYLRDFYRWLQRRGRGRFGYIQELEERILGLISRCFAEGIEQGQFIPADPRLLTYMLRGLVRAVGFYHLSQGRKKAIKEALPLLIRFALTGFTRKPQEYEGRS